MLRRSRPPGQQDLARDALRQLETLLVYPTTRGWFVKGEAFERPRRYATKEQAIAFARGWAESNRPCLVKLELDDRRIAGEWDYDDPLK